MKLSGTQASVVTWGGIGIVAVGLGYVVIKWVIPAIAKAAADSASKAAGSLSSGTANTVNAALGGLSDNNLTRGNDASGKPAAPSGFGGDYNYDYSGFGPASTLGAATNKVSGGLFADIGEGVGHGLYSIFGSSYDPTAPVYIVSFPDGSRHGVDSNNIDSSGRFSYGGVTYTLGDDGSGNKVATALTTVYGSGAG